MDCFNLLGKWTLIACLTARFGCRVLEVKTSLVQGLVSWFVSHAVIIDLS